MWLQLLFNSLVSGLMLALVATGFYLVFHVTRTFHLAHGALYVAGGYIYLWLNDLFPYQLSPGNQILILLSTFMGVILISWIIEWLIYRPLMRRNAGQAITLIASMGIYLFLVNFIALLFGNESRILDPQLGNSIILGNLVIAPMQGVQFLAGLLILMVLLLLSRTNGYLKVRAVISNPIVASVLGIPVPQIRLFAIAAGSLLAAIPAILRLFDTGLDPQAGMGITLSAAVAIIVGGSGSLKGTILAALLISVLQTLTEWFLSAQWKEGITFLLLILVILWRTEGIVSYKMRLEEK